MINYREHQLKVILEESTLPDVNTLTTTYKLSNKDALAIVEDKSLITMYKQSPYGVKREFITSMIQQSSPAIVSHIHSEAMKNLAANPKDIVKLLKSIQTKYPNVYYDYIERDKRSRKFLFNKFKIELNKELHARTRFLSVILFKLIPISRQAWSTYFRPISKALKPLLGIDFFPSLDEVSKHIDEILESITWNSIDKSISDGYMSIAFILESMLSSDSVWNSMYLKNNTIYLKLIGDARSLSRTCTQTLVGFSILNLVYLTNSPYNFYCCMLMKGSDEYFALANHLPRLFNELGYLQQKGLVVRKLNKTFNIHYVWTGDGKFRRTLLGRSSAGSLYPCPYCSAKKDQLYLYSQECMPNIANITYNTDELEQELEETIKRRKISSETASTTSVVAIK